MATRVRRYIPKHDKLTREQKQAWLSENQGAFSRIARITGFSRAHISRVFWGTRHNQFISRALDAAIYRNGNKRFLAA